MKGRGWIEEAIPDLGIIAPHPPFSVRVANTGLAGKIGYRRERNELGFLTYPPLPPGNSDGYQKKGVAGGAVCMNVKKKELDKRSQSKQICPGRWCGRQTGRDVANYTGQCIVDRLSSQELFLGLLVG